MKSVLNRQLILGAALALAIPASAFATEYELDSVHSNASFAVKHMMVSTVHGKFDKLSGTFNYDEKNPTKSTLEATIDASSVDTGVAKRDADLKSPHFFDVQKFPTITFKSTKVVKAKKGHLKITGDLTMHGVTKSVVLDVEGPTAAIKDPYGMMRIGASATTTVNRQDFGISLSQAMESGGVVVGNEVKISIDAELTQKKVEAAAVPAPAPAKGATVPAAAKKK